MQSWQPLLYAFTTVTADPSVTYPAHVLAFENTSAELAFVPSVNAVVRLHRSFATMPNRKRLVGPAVAAVHVPSEGLTNSAYESLSTSVSSAVQACANPS